MIRRAPAPRRGPSLMGTMARTAVIAGTATAVSGNVAQKQHAKASAAQQQQAAKQAMHEATAQAQADVAQMQQQLELLQAQQAMQSAAPAAAPAPATGGADLIAQLQQLGELKTAGILSDAEFEAAKARLLTA